jgi:hypothetical protein
MVPANSVKKGAIFEVRLIMLLLKTYLIFNVGLSRFLILLDTDHHAIVAKITFGKLYIHRDM